MTKDTALRKSIHIFEGLRRMLSVSENGLTPDKGCADSFAAIDETVQALKEMLRDLQSDQPAEMKYWQKEIYENGPPERLDFKEEDAVPAEVEGGGNTWWIVCGKCHGAIDVNDRYCKHCGGKVSWT